MKAGAVIVDIAAESGGNCELTCAGETVVHHGVRIVGPVNLPSSARLPRERNVLTQPASISQARVEGGELAIDWEDEVFAKSCLTHAGEIRHEATRSALS